ncbi:hypothetical protein DQ04_04281060 [Trypanosoma grayi]|uniref:hypothetical protein n=1 Tax=Trypanosoma grayi TaxID=71804 RepID=UPI0004F494FC|nr:hypothetical protein DQ04_04281060 [Trypanosoma grayi]KEG10030.1 hypothetical protein DQ04_04281060 [Trypanosoma grayi]
MRSACSAAHGCESNTRASSSATIIAVCSGDNPLDPAEDEGDETHLRLRRSAIMYSARPSARCGCHSTLGTAKTAATVMTFCRYCTAT